MKRTDRFAQIKVVRRRSLVLVGSLAVGAMALVPTPAVASDGVVPDPVLRACINEALRHEQDAPIAETELGSLRTLECEDNDLTDLSGLQHATSLTRLSIHAGDPYGRCDTDTAVDLDPILSLTQLKELELECVGLNQLAPLTVFSELSDLSVRGNGITDIAPLSQLVKLERLYLQANDVSDLTPLRNLTHMRVLLLDSNNIVDLGPLAELRELTFFTAVNNLILDIEPLSGLTRLEELALDANQISDVGPLRPLVNLQHVSLLGNQVADIAPLSTLTNLSTLEISEQRIELPDARVGDTITFEALGLKGETLPLYPAADYKLTQDGIVLLEAGRIELAWATPFILGSADTGFAGAAYVTAHPRPPIWKWIGIGAAAIAVIAGLAWLRRLAVTRDAKAASDAAQATGL